MIGTLEEKLGVKFPPGDHLHTDDANTFLRELCVRVCYLFCFSFVGITLIMRLVVAQCGL